MTNIVIVTGRLTADLELRCTGETPLCKFRIAVDRPKKKGADKSETDFFNCTAWNHNAEFINDMFSKGEIITIVGNLRSSYSGIHIQLMNGESFCTDEDEED